MNLRKLEGNCLQSLSQDMLAFAEAALRKQKIHRFFFFFTTPLTVDFTVKIAPLELLLAAPTVLWKFCIVIARCFVVSGGLG